MQIFITDPDPRKSADYLWSNPNRARKMITESMQIMACALEHFGCEEQLKKANGESYSTPKSRMNHPVVKWAYKDKSNLLWLCIHCTQLYLEYSKRGGKAFKNIPDNINIIHNNFKGKLFDIMKGEGIEFLNFAKCKSKDLDFTSLLVFDAYQKYLEAQDARSLKSDYGEK